MPSLMSLQAHEFTLRPPRRPVPARRLSAGRSKSADTLTIVSNRLPVTLSDRGIERSSGGLVSALEGVGAEVSRVNWIGWPGKDVPAQHRSAIAESLNREHGCTPVFVPD